MKNKLLPPGKNEPYYVVHNIKNYHGKKSPVVFLNIRKTQKSRFIWGCCIGKTHVTDQVSLVMNTANYLKFVLSVIYCPQFKFFRRLPEKILTFHVGDPLLITFSQWFIKYKGMTPRGKWSSWSRVCNHINRRKNSMEI